jgi:phosphate transport system substrate-binding protein
MRTRTLRIVLPLIAALAAGCTPEAAPKSGDPAAPAAPASPAPTGKTTVTIDGSSTVFPISAAIAEKFQEKNRGVRVTVGLSGTGGGFKKFGAGEIDISDASRPIKESEEKIAAEHGIGFIEIPVAFDGMSIVVNKNNRFVDHLTIAELKEIWALDGKFRKWKDVRPNWPDKPIVLYGPGTNSGTFDYFVEAVLGKDGKCRPDFTASEDDNVIVTGVSGDPDSLGYFGFAYYKENSEILRAVPIADGSKAPVMPSVETINNGTYSPLSRPIFIYVSDKASARGEVRSFVEFYLDHAAETSSEVGYVALPESVYAEAKKRFGASVTGSIFRTAEAGTDIEALMRASAKPE